MIAKLKQMGTRGRLGSLLVLMVMLPAMFFSVYEFASLSRSEELIADVYRQQLDVVLFSLNQYSWDIANSWANAVNDELSARSTTETERDARFVDFLKENTGVLCLFIADDGPSSPRLYRSPSGGNNASRVEVAEIVDVLRKSSGTLDRLSKLQASGYRKIEPLYIAGADGRKLLALVFVSGARDRNGGFAGLVIDEERFIQEVLAQKMGEAAGDNFLLSVNRKDSDRAIYATDALDQGEARQTKDLWLFSDHTVGIRLKGKTIEEIVQYRFFRSLLLIGLMSVVLVAGVWVVYRTVLREVELAQLKSDFVSNVSHEIKTPLALIRMFAETLQMGRVRSEAMKKEYYDTIVQESERLTRLINNILNFSRMEAGKKEYDFKPADLNQVVNGILKNYSAHLEHHGFTVHVETGRILPSVMIDSGSVSEAILNVIDNAVKYSRNEKHIRISTGTESTSVFVEVEDRGVGIDPGQQKRIFEKFYRGASGLTHTTSGTGLGLTLVKHIMDAHGGSITLQSEKGKGSTFRLVFPMRMEGR